MPRRPHVLPGTSRERGACILRRYSSYRMPRPGVSNLHRKTNHQTQITKGQDVNTPKLLDGFQLVIPDGLFYPGLHSNILLIADDCGHYTVQWDVNLHVDSHDNAVAKMAELVTLLGILGGISAVQLSPEDLASIQIGAEHQ